jgi:hypothetical protein
MAGLNDPNRVWYASNDTKNPYLVWLTSQYPEVIKDPTLLKKLMDIDGQYYNHWVEYVWKPANNFEWDNKSKTYKWPSDMITVEPAPPLPTGETQSYENPQVPLAPTSFSSTLPNQISVGGKFYPVNYVSITDPVDETNSKGGKTGRTISLYAPVVDANNLSPDVMNEIYKNIYAVKDNGEMVYPRALTSEELSSSGAIPFNAVNQTSDLSELTRTITSTALKKWAKDNGMPLSSSDIDNYVNSSPDSVISNISQLKKNLTEKLQGAPIDNQRTEKMAQFSDAQINEGQAVQAGEPNASDFGQKSDYLKALTDYYKPQYDKYLPSYNQQNETKTISSDMSAQFGYTAVKKYLDSQAEYNAIKSGNAPDTTMGQYMNRPDLETIAQKYNVPLNAYMDTANKYMENNTSPEFSNLSMGAKQDLGKAALAGGWQDQGAVVQQQRDEQARLKTEQEKQYQALLAKARLTQVTPQRQVSL